MELDSIKLAISKQVALGRWGKPFAASIKAKLDEPKEWVDEAHHLNNELMPPLLAAKEPRMQWFPVLPAEFGDPQVTTVGSYALFIYVHLKYVVELAGALKALRTEHLDGIEAGDEDHPKDAIDAYIELYSRGGNQ